MIVGVSGHRPAKLGVYKLPNPIYDTIISRTKSEFEKLKPEKIITGMCIGYDQWCAEVAIEMNIPFVAAVPFVGQELLWPQDAQTKYKELLAKAEHIEIVNPGGFASWKMQARNQWIVDNCNLMLVVLKQSIKWGGTYNCVEYARAQNKELTIINPSEFESLNK